MKLIKKNKGRTKLSLIMLSVLFLTGCSFSFIYNHLDWWANWYLDDYVTLNDEQQIAFDKSFNDLHTWHRTTQLAIYQQQLKQLQRQVNEGISQENLELHFDQVRNHWMTLREYAKPQLISLTEMLSFEQREEFMFALKESNDERLADHDDEPLDEWQADLCKGQQKDIKKWIGKLTREQKSEICKVMKGLQPTFYDWMDYRQRWYQSFLAIMSPQELSRDFEYQFAELISQPEKFKSQEYLNKSLENRKVSIALMVYVFNSLTDKQVNTFNNRVGDLIEDLHELENDS